jgi:prepilin-type processing-associated H-X9-DG protein
MDHFHCPPGLTAKQKTGTSGFVVILPQLEQQALYDRLDVADGGLWNDNVSDLGWYRYDYTKAVAVRQRPDVFVCPSDTAKAISTVFPPIRAATGSYAFVQGSLGPDMPAEKVKYENTGIFLYAIPRRLSEVTDGLSCTFMIGEVVASDTWESSNIWTYALVHADCLRSTRNPLGTSPGGGESLNRQNGAFGSRHPSGALFAFGDGHVLFVSDSIDVAAYQALSTIQGSETSGSTAF